MAGLAAAQVDHLGLRPYAETLEAMRAYTRTRGANSPDRLWLLEHAPVFTQGQAGKSEHLLKLGDIPLVQSDRGGQVTYHGPGQLIVYVMLDLGRAGYGVRSLVTRLETAMIGTLAGYGIAAYADPAAPGVYVDLRGQRHKIGSLGLRVRHARSYHGLSLNVNMDLEPFRRINPCGYAGLPMTQVSALGGPSLPCVRTDLEAALLQELYA